MVRKGTFRSDLYYRLDVVRLEVPPLRHRKEDILPLAEYFLENQAAFIMSRPRPSAKTLNGSCLTTPGPETSASLQTPLSGPMS